MNSKFYIHPENLNLNWFERIPTTEDIFPSFFYLFFLPKYLKIKFLDILEDDDKEIYKEILNISPTLSKNIENSDFIITKPFYYDNGLFYELNVNKKYIKEAIKYNKKILLFCGDTKSNDILPQNLHKNIILFTGGGEYFNKKNIYGLPTFSKDYFDGTYLKKKISISFCGTPITSQIRFDVIDRIQKSRYSNFIIRNNWGGHENSCCDKEHGKYFLTVPPAKERKLEFIENMRDNLYALCMRGDENFSFRLGEILMMGRIPVIIDTKCIFPFRDQIPYEKNSIMINYKNLDSMISIIENYHNLHTEDELIKIQKENRNIWLQYFTPVGAFYSVLSILEKENNKTNHFQYNYV